jgi:RNA polymerase sigma factor (sigma-70 family)
MIDKNNYSIHQELIDRCRVGDRLAQREIYRLYYKAMYNTCYRMLNNQVDAEDVMQESFLAAFLKINTYKGEMAFGAWLKRIVINKTIDVLRTRKVKFEEINEKAEQAKMTYEVITELQEIEDSEKIAAIKKAICLLPEGFRVVLSLALFEGYDHEEIAQILHIEESTSRSQLARAKKKLVAYLKNGNDGTL